MRKDDLECTTEGCNLAKEVSKATDTLEALKTALEQDKIDTKAGFAKFERKQDQIVEILSEWKAMMTEIKNIKDAQQRIDAEIIRDQNGLREDKIAIWNRINELEKNKAEKTDMKENRGWLWGLVIVILTVLINFIVDAFKAKIGIGGK